MSDTVSVSHTQGAFTAQANGKPVAFLVHGQTAQPAPGIDAAGVEGAVVGAFLSPDGKRLAYSITDANQQNPVVRVVNLADNSGTELIKYNGGDRLSCFIWKPDGSQLAFMRTSPSEDPNQPYIAQIWVVPVTGGNSTKIYGDDLLQFLGWSADGQKIYLTRRIKGLFSYSILTVANGQTENIMLPNSNDGQQNLDIIGLTYGSSAGKARLAYLLNSSPYLQNSAATPLLVVEAASGKLIKQTASEGAATNLTFSPDLSLVAYSTYKFPEGTGAGSQQADAGDAQAGVQVLTVDDATGDTVRSIIPARAGAGHYSILAWAGDKSGLFVESQDGAVQFVDFQGNAASIVGPSASADSLSVGGDAGVHSVAVAGSVVNIEVPYIHQIRMTPDDFNGNWACGPTAATMVAAFYGKLSPRNDVFGGNPTQYGWYVSNVFKSNATGFTFTRTTADASGRPFPGAYGHCVEGGEGYAWRMVDYLNKLGLAAKFQSSASISVIKRYLNEGKPVVLSTNLHGFGHIVCLKGYTSDGRWIVNDNYWGRPGAGQVVYTWGDFQGPPWMITIDTPPPTPGQSQATPQPVAVGAPPPSTETVEPGTGNDTLKPRFAATVRRLGGGFQVGSPEGKVFNFNQRSIQNFKGGALGDGILMADERNDRPGDHPVPTLQPVFGVFGAFLRAWRDSYGGSGGALGSPLSDVFVNSQGDSQQNFEGGYLLMHGQSDNLQGAFPWPSGFNGWKAEYYNNSGLAGKPAFQRDETASPSGGLSYNWGEGAPDNGRIGILSDNFSARFSRSINFGDGGTYNFVVTADDGFRLTIDGQNLAGVNPDQYWQLSSAAPHNFRVAVGGGVHTLVLEYFEGGGSAVIQLDINQE